MKKYIIPALVVLPALLWSCKDDAPIPGNPTFNYKDEAGTAHFGDSLVFTVNAADAEVPLSTLKAQLFYGEEMVEETVIRTKVSGEDYTGKIYLPYFADVPDGTATLKLKLQNINFTITEKEYDLAITHANYPYLTLKMENGDEYRMTKADGDNYSVKAKFDQKFKAFVVAPAVGEFGNELTFGYANGAVAVGSDNAITFSSAKGGKFAVSFNTRSFEFSPFVTLKINDTEVETIDDDNAKVDLTLTQGQSISLEGFANIGEWWIDPDWFTRNADGTLTFMAMGGDYRIIANQALQYFRVEKLAGGKPATLADDGSGALWIIGAGIGKPGVGTNEVGWTTEKAICMAPVADKVYQVTVVGGKTVKTESINFKYFGQMGWGVELGGADLTSQSPLVGVGTGDNGHDNGNLYLEDGVTLKDNTIYVFRVDLTAGRHAGIMTVTEAGEQPFEEIPMSVNGTKMKTGDNSVYKATIELKQGAELVFDALSGADEYWMDPDFLSYDEDNDAISFLPVDGNYEITLNKAFKTIAAQRMDAAGKPITLGDDGHGAVYVLGWGVGSPSLDNQFGWTESNAYGMAEISPKVYQFTAVAGPETGSKIGQRIRTDYTDAKFFWQKGWGGEFGGANNLKLVAGGEYINVKDSGNLEFVQHLEEDATYVITIDLSAGNNAGTLSFKKK